MNEATPAQSVSFTLLDDLLRRNPALPGEELRKGFRNLLGRALGIAFDRLVEFGRHADTAADRRRARGTSGRGAHSYHRSHARLLGTFRIRFELLKEKRRRLRALIHLNLGSQVCPP